MIVDSDFIVFCLLKKSKLKNLLPNCRKSEMAEPRPAASQVDGKRKNAKQEQCEMCEKKQSTGYCSQCEMYICQSCFDLHKKIKRCRNHILLDAPDSNMGDSDEDYDTCVEHVNQTIRFYCTEHKCFGCGDCMLFAHNQCKCEYISEASRRFQESGELANLLEDIKSLENTHQECTDAIVSQTEASVMIGNSAKNQITKFAESMITYVTETKSLALKEVESKVKKNKQQINQLKDDAQVVGERLDDIRASFQNEERVNKLFMLSVESKPKLASIRDTLSHIDCNVVTEFSFQASKLLEDFALNARPLGRFTDSSQDDELDLETNLKKEQKRADMLCQQLRSQREESERTINNLTKALDDVKLQHESLMTELRRRDEAYKSEITLLCGHKNTIQMMTENRTIRCGVCNIIYGDQPEGTIQFTDNHGNLHKITMTFPSGTQSKLNVKPGEKYKNAKYECYLAYNQEGNSLLNMIKLAFQRRLVFTIGDNGEIVPGVIEIFREKPWEWRYCDYVARVKKQLADVGITH